MCPPLGDSARLRPGSLRHITLSRRAHGRCTRTGGVRVFSVSLLIFRATYTARAPRAKYDMPRVALNPPHTRAVYVQRLRGYPPGARASTLSQGRQAIGHAAPSLSPPTQVVRDFTGEFAVAFEQAETPAETQAALSSHRERQRLWLRRKRRLPWRLGGRRRGPAWLLARCSRQWTTSFGPQACRGAWRTSCRTLRSPGGVGHASASP